MKLENLLDKQVIDTQSLNPQPIQNDTPFGIILSGINDLENSGYELIETHSAKDYTLKDFKKEDDSLVRVVDDRFVIFKKDFGCIFNWSIDFDDFVKGQDDDNHITGIRYYFNFPKGRYSDKAIIDICNNKSLPVQAIVDPEIKNNASINAFFFQTEELDEQLANALQSPLNGQFNIADIIEIGYIEANRKTDTFFIEPDNYYYQNYQIPKVIVFNDGKPVRKDYELEEPKGHVVEVDLVNNEFKHPIKTLAQDRLYLIQLMYRDDLFEPAPSIIFSTFIKDRKHHIIKPFMGYPNGFDLINDCPKWFNNNFQQQDVSEKARALIDGKDYENLDAFSKAYFNYSFGIGNTEAFEDALDMIMDKNNISEFEMFLIEPHIEGDFFYKDVYNKLKENVQKYK